MLVNVYLLLMQDGIRREVHTMSLIDHPNLLHAHCSFTAGHSLWVVMPYMAGGSCLHIMKTTYPEGFEEPVIATLLRETLKALVYLHAHGHIHRDVKVYRMPFCFQRFYGISNFNFCSSDLWVEIGDQMRLKMIFTLICLFIKTMWNDCWKN